MFLIGNVWAQETSPLFILKHLPTFKTLASFEKYQCKNEKIQIGPYKELTARCSVTGNQKKIIILDGEKTILILSSVLRANEQIDSKASVIFRAEHLEVNF